MPAEQNLVADKVLLFVRRSMGTLRLLVNDKYIAGCSVTNRCGRKGAGSSNLWRSWDDSSYRPPEGQTGISMDLRA